MKLTGSHHIALASSQDGKLPEWIQLLPQGVATPQDDVRAPWLVSDPQAIALASRAKLPMFIDVDHAFDLNSKGTPNPAFGWIEDVVGEGPAKEPGVWGRVAWTGLGQRALASREYRYISPVFFHDKETREVSVILRATLTNDPALPLKALASRQAEPAPENPMSLVAIAGALALAATATEAEIVSAIGALSSEKKALASRLTSIGKAAGIEGEIGDDQAVALCAKVQAAPVKPGYVSQADFDKLQLELASVQRTMSGDRASDLVEKAIAGGRLTPAQREWAVGYASREPAEFAKFIGGQPKILEGGQVVPGDPAAGELTAQQKELCARHGIKEEQYKAALAKKEAA